MYQAKIDQLGRKECIYLKSSQNQLRFHLTMESYLQTQDQWGGIFKEDLEYDVDACTKLDELLFSGQRTHEEWLYDSTCLVPSMSVLMASISLGGEGPQPNQLQPKAALMRKSPLLNKLPLASVHASKKIKIGVESPNTDCIMAVQSNKIAVSTKVTQKPTRVVSIQPVMNAVTSPPPVFSSSGTKSVVNPPSTTKTTKKIVSKQPSTTKTIKTDVIKQLSTTKTIKETATNQPSTTKKATTLLSFPVTRKLRDRTKIKKRDFL